MSDERDKEGQAQGFKVSDRRKRYDEPATPYRRLLELAALTPETAARLKEQYLALNPAALRRRLTDNEKRLARMCSLKMQIRRKEVAATG